MRSWLDLHPARLTSEVAELERIGFVVDERELSRSRRLVARGKVQASQGQQLRLTIIYPDTFPYLRPEVYAPELRLRRHQNPYEGNLCLLDRSTLEWEVDDTGAWLITDRVPLLLDLLERGGEALTQGEAPQGEPWSSYLRTEPGTVIFLPEASLDIPDEEKAGRLDLGFGTNEGVSPRLRALLKRVTAPGGRHGKTLAEAHGRLGDRFAGDVVEGRWVRLSGPPADSTPAGLLEAAVAVDPDLRRPRWRKAGNATIDVVGCLIQEEVAHGHSEAGWVFIVRMKRTTGPRASQEVAYVTHGARLTERDYVDRIPSLTSLRDRSALVIGLGGLGGPIAVELARCGIGNLHLVDGDAVEVGNTVRWPLGLSAVGWPKANAISGWLGSEYPYTNVSYIAGHIGRPAPVSSLGDRDVSELDALTDLIDRADLIIDATAELGVQHLLSDLAADKPQIYVWATEGATGGVVVRVRQDTGCWLCLQLHIRDETIAPPAAIPGATVQPRGCASPTFTGTAYDLAPVSNQAVRVAVAQMLNSSVQEQDVSICSLYSNSEWLPVPKWDSGHLTVHPECARCSEALAA